jgi:long-chain acyl-CoA synthetase
MGYPGVHALTRPDHPAVVMSGSGEVVTYRALDEGSNRLAQVLRAHGLRRGDHVALFAENHPRYMEVVWAALRSGLYLTAVNSYLSAHELQYILSDCDARVVIASTARAAVAGAVDPSVVPGVERWLMIDSVGGGHADGIALGAHWEPYDEVVGQVPATPVEDESPGVTMLYSSGTTGRPKGVKRPLPTHPVEELDERTATAMTGLYGYHSEMVYLSPAPMYHAAPLAFSTSVHRVGGTVVMMERFDAELCLEAIERHSVTHGQFVPTMFVRMLKLPEARRLAHDVSSLEVAIHAAAPCPVPVKHEMIAWWGPILYEYYAGSEGNGATFITSEEWLARPGSVGRPRAGRLHICDDEGNELPPGEPGTIYFSGGGEYEYYKDPAKTAEARLPDGRTTLGDVGYLDEDGYLIISGGVNIYPQEIEDCLVLHPAVADVAVFGVPDPDMGEQVKAVVQPAEGVEGSQALAEELIGFTRERIAHFKCPRSVDFEPELPRLPTGKLYKRLLRDRYWGTSGSTIV